MTGYATIKKIRDFESRAESLGFVVREPATTNVTYQGTTYNYSSVWIDEVSSERISLAPAEGRYPGWGNHGTEVFTGTIEEAMFFLQGIEFAHLSDASINLTSVKKRQAAEARMVERLRKAEEERVKKEEQKKVWDILKFSKQYKKEDEVPF
jgi:hypothetical protein